jgi:hypothetical protein
MDFGGGDAGNPSMVDGNNIDQLFGLGSHEQHIIDRLKRHKLKSFNILYNNSNTLFVISNENRN